MMTTSLKCTSRAKACVVYIRFKCSGRSIATAERSIATAKYMLSTNGALRQVKRRCNRPRFLLEQVIFLAVSTRYTYMERERELGIK